MKKPIRIGVVGLGKIAQAEHLPAIERNPDFELAFVVDRAVTLDVDVPAFTSLLDAVQSGHSFDAISVCTSPQVRFELCQILFERDVATLLEKPAAATLHQTKDIERRAREIGMCIFASWHSRFAPFVPAAEKWVRAHEIQNGQITWRENAQKWHPGQDWIWRDGGFGVFDPGMNALSILTRILPHEWKPDDAKIFVPTNVETPNRADFSLIHENLEIKTHFEFHDHDDDTWAIELHAKNGSSMELYEGGAGLRIDGSEVKRSLVVGEYDGVYTRFAELIMNDQSDFDFSPLKIIDDVFATADIFASAPISV